MSSRAKKKRQKAGLPEPHQRGEEAPDTKLDWDGEEGIPLTKNQERYVEMFFGALVFFVTAGGGTFWLLESWIVALACGLVAAVIAIVLVRRGETLF